VFASACEAQYHQSCRNKYSQNPEKWRSKNEDSKERQSHTEKAHREAFDIVKSFETYGVYFQNHYCLQWMMAVLASDSGSL
jgi:hypothetical protein